MIIGIDGAPAPTAEGALSIDAYYAGRIAVAKTNLDRALRDDLRGDPMENHEPNLWDFAKNMGKVVVGDFRLAGAIVSAAVHGVHTWPQR